MTITALPTPPSRAIPATFADLGDSFLGALPAFATEANALEANVDALEAASAVSAAAAAASAAAAAASAAADIWVSGTTYAIGDVAWSPANAQSYRRITAGAGTTDPMADGTNWTLIYVGNNSINRSARTSNTILGTADRGTLVDITSGTFTQTFTAAATLGAGWYCYLANTGTGTVTLDPSASELIDGAATLTLLPADRILIQCTGAAFYSATKPEIPAQVSHSGKYLTTNGTTASWGSLPLYALLADPTFSGTVVLPSTTSIGTVSSTEIGYLDNVTSAIQTQLNAKAGTAGPTFSGAVDMASATSVSAPTKAAGTNTTDVATTAFVTGAVGGYAANAVGTYVFATATLITAINQTVAGSDLKGAYISSVPAVTNDGGVYPLSGTWRSMSHGGANGASLFIRIS